MLSKMEISDVMQLRVPTARRCPFAWILDFGGLCDPELRALGFQQRVHDA